MPHEEETPNYLPIHDDMTSEDLWKAYNKANIINPATGVHKVKTRQKKEKKHRDVLKQTIDDILQLGEEQSNIGHLDTKERKEVAAHAIAKLVEEGYASVSKSGKGPEVNEDTIKMYLQDIQGILVDYNGLIKEIMNASDLGYDTLAQNAPNLKLLLDHVASSKVEESRLIQSITRTMQKIEHLDPIKELAGKYLGIEFDASATIQDVLNDYQLDLQKKDFDYNQKIPDKTHIKKPEYDKKQHYQKAA